MLEEASVGSVWGTFLDEYVVRPTKNISAFYDLSSSFKTSDRASELKGASLLML